jgi:hypothetical protein
MEGEAYRTAPHRAALAVAPGEDALVLAMGRKVMKCRSQSECAQKQLSAYVSLSTLRLRSALNDFMAHG